MKMFWSAVVGALCSVSLTAAIPGGEECWCVTSGGCHRPRGAACSLPAGEPGVCCQKASSGGRLVDGSVDSDGEREKRNLFDSEGVFDGTYDGGFGGSETAFHSRHDSGFGYSGGGFDSRYDSGFEESGGTFNSRHDSGFGDSGGAFNSRHDSGFGDSGGAFNSRRDSGFADSGSAFNSRQDNVQRGFRRSGGRGDRTTDYGWGQDIFNRNNRPRGQTTTTEAPASWRDRSEGSGLSGHRNVRLLPLDECGGGIAFRINNGKRTGIGVFPWLALIRYVDASGEKVDLCGGSLINSRYVLTAAHCVKSMARDRVQIRSVVLGEYDLDKDPDCDELEDGRECSAAMEVRAEEVVRHPDYGTGNVNDIALIRLAQPVTFTKFISPICLPLKEVSFTNGSIAGWGRTETGLFSRVKLYAEVPMVNETYCVQTYQSRYRRRLQPSIQLCAGGAPGNKDSCGGDSGGPLMAVSTVGRDRSNRFVAVGLVSFGPRDCGTPGVPGVYTRVFPYVKWILDTIRP